MVYPLVGCMFFCTVGSISPIVELTVDQHSFNNMLDNFCDQSGVVVDSFPEPFGGFGKQLTM